MNLYRVILSETGFYSILVEAEDEKEAKKLALIRRMATPKEPYDFGPIDILQVNFVKGIPNRASYKKESSKWSKSARLNRRRG